MKSSLFHHDKRSLSFQSQLRGLLDFFSKSRVRFNDRQYLLSPSRSRRTWSDIMYVMLIEEILRLGWDACRPKANSQSSSLQIFFLKLFFSTFVFRMRRSPFGIEGLKNLNGITRHCEGGTFTDTQHHQRQEKNLPSSSVEVSKQAPGTTIPASDHRQQQQPKQDHVQTCRSQPWAIPS